MMELLFLAVLTIATWLPLWPMLFPREPYIRAPKIVADIPVSSGSYNLRGVL